MLGRSILSYGNVANFLPTFSRGLIACVGTTWNRTGHTALGI